MTDQKAENLLNLALDTPEAERKRTEDLNVGYEEATRSWELIVRYHGNLRETLRENYPEAGIREFLGGFAVLNVPERLVDQIIDLDEIEYAEKPKRLFFALNQARTASCVSPVQQEPDPLNGNGVLVAVLDSGIDYFHGDFRNPDGSTRILYLFDQISGTVYTSDQINEALASGSREKALTLVPVTDPSGHGTAVAGIAAGNGRESGGRYRGIAPESELLVVRLGVPDPEGFPRTTQLMEGLDSVVRTALELGRPVAVNMSFGNTYGSHDGEGLLERYIDTLAGIGKNVLVTGSGNEGDAGGHMAGILREGEEFTAELSVAPFETGLNIQLWKSYLDDVDIYLENPSGDHRERVSSRLGPHKLDMGSTDVLVYYGEPGPFNSAQEIYFDFVPGNTYVESGIWKILLRAGNIVMGNFDLWLPSSAVLNRSTRFLRPEPDTTLTIPSTAARVITVGAYEDANGTYAPFSGRGSEENPAWKPDLAAPGVGIVAPLAGGGYGPVTGTSYAAPFVSGAAALLMEWGIVKKNDPYLYGDKVKEYLKKGARPLPGELEYPNPRVGYGALCVADSIPE